MRNATTSLSVSPLHSGPRRSYRVSAETLSQQLWHSVYVPDTLRETLEPNILKTGTATTLLILLMCLPLQRAHTYRARYAAERMRPATPSSKVAMVMLWMKTQLPRTAIVAGNWRLRQPTLTCLQVSKPSLIRTPIYRIGSISNDQYVHNAEQEQEALAFLKTHGVTHIMLTRNDPKDTLLRGQLSEAFRPVYPTDKFADAEVKMWELHYPPDIKTDAKYLKNWLPRNRCTFTTSINMLVVCQPSNER